MESFGKGDLVRFITSRPDAWRRTTGEERQMWYLRLAEDCKAGRDVPYDSGGESRLAPSDHWLSFNDPLNTTLIVNRARVNAPRGYGSRSHCLEVTDPATGQTFFVMKTQVTQVKGD
jgi:hypothetical protein